MKRMTICNDEIKIRIDNYLSVYISAGGEYFVGDPSSISYHTWNSTPSKFGNILGWSDTLIDHLAMIFDTIRVAYNYFIDQDISEFIEAYEALRVLADHLQMMINNDDNGKKARS